ncbi:MAG: WYL domain-containing protein [Syntrophorhabdaceae bacterium]|nr:WYL domain-containing protein [Syntrophorhabdaceae bacterium]
MTESRKATYTSAVKIARLVSMLSSAWRPLSLEQITNILGVSPRTLARYKKALNENLSASDGTDFIKVIKEGGKEYWYLTDQEDINTANGFRIISVFVVKTLLKFLEGTVIKDNIDNIWNTITGQMPPSRKKQLEYFDRKIRYTGFGSKQYEDKDIVLASTLRALLHQFKMKIIYLSGTSSKGKERTIHPYTLLLHRDALYLIAYDESVGDIRTFLIDRIEDARVINENFKYPRDYNPETLTEGSFGLYDSRGKEPFKVKVAFKAYLWDYITTRKWHPTQRFKPVKDGWFTMEVEISHIIEFIPWILAFGKEAKVVEPESLKETIKNEIQEALGYY